MTLIFVLLALYVVLVGLVLGSFVTALVHRHRHGWSMWAKRSQCPHCKHVLRPLDLLPVVSYVWLGGKCRYCGHSIGRQYLLTELSCAGLLLYGLSFLWYQISLIGQFEWWWVASNVVFVGIMLVLALALTIYDLRWGELPNQWTLGGAALAVVMVGLATVSDQPMLWQPTVMGFEASWWSSLLSGLICAAVFVGIVYFSEVVLRKPGMGMGDAKLALMIGIFVGFPTVVVAMYVAFIFGAVLSLLLVAGKRKSMGASVPFGPFMIFGMFASLWISPAVVAWYSTLWM